MKKVFIIESPGVEIDGVMWKYINDNFEIIDSPNGADYGLVFGGDGGMLHAVWKYREIIPAFFGLNYGHEGRLMNDRSVAHLEALSRGGVETISARLLKAMTYDNHGNYVGSYLAFNNFYFEKAARVKTVKIRVCVDGEVYFNPLIANGIIVSTPAGSSAYNFSSGGIWAPVGHHDGIMLTAICPSGHYHWRTIELRAGAEIVLEIIDFDRLPALFWGDVDVISADIVRAEIGHSDKTVNLLFAPSQTPYQKYLNIIFNRK